MGIFDKFRKTNKETGPTSSQLIRRTRGQWTDIDKVPEAYDDVPLDGGPKFVGGKLVYTIGELKEAKLKEYLKGYNGG